MDQIRISGGKSLKGSVRISGAKNAALPLLFATLLTDKKCTFKNVPDLHDIQFTAKILEQLGVKTELNLKNGEASFDAGHVSTYEATYDLVRKMRASVLCLGPLVARFGSAKVSLPGGCAIGNRPVNFHLTALEKLGAHIELEGGYVLAKAKKLKGSRIVFEFPSVGATEHIMMAASLAEGESILENCAREPEIVDLANMLRSMGIRVEGDGTSTIHIQGTKNAKGCHHTVIGDRIEAGTYLSVGFATQGDVKVEGIDPEFLRATLDKFTEAGAKVTEGKDWIRLESQGRPKGVDIRTAPHPGFPTDMQAQFMAVASIADGVSMITETIFENRFMHVPELCRLGADIVVRGEVATVRGVPKLLAAPLMATDLRASASLIIGALCAEGESVISRVYHLDRGYERLEEKLGLLGADVTRVKA